MLRHETCIGACDFLQVRNTMAKISPLYEFAGICARRRGSDPWVLPGYTAGHIYVGVLKAAMDIVGLAGGPCGNLATI